MGERTDWHLISGRENGARMGGCGQYTLDLAASKSSTRALLMCVEARWSWVSSCILIV